MDDPTCNQCGDPVPNFQQINGKWLGNPVLYMGRDKNGYACKYQFCCADCLIDWLCEVQGLELKSDSA